MEEIKNQDRKSSLFFGDRELTFVQRIATEVIECVTQQKIKYYAIEGTLTEADDLYGEAINKVFRQPIEIYALVLYNEPVIETGSFSTETRYSLKIYIQKFRIEHDLKMTPRMGDFIEFNNHYFEISRCWEPQLIAGLDTSGFKMGIYIECISTRKDVFNPKNISLESINPDVIR